MADFHANAQGLGHTIVSLARKIQFIFILSASIFAGQESCLMAQTGPPVSKRIQKQFRQARDLYLGLEWQEAEEQLKEITSKAPSYIDAWLLLGELALEMENQELAYYALRNVTRLDSINYLNIFPELAKLAYEKGNYSEALIELRKSRVPYHDQSLNLEERIHFAIDQVRKNKGAPQPVPLGINSNENEYFPSLTVDGQRLVFTRQERNKEGTGQLGQEDLYESQYIDSDFSTANILPGPITTEGNEGTQSVRQDGRLMFFTACKRPDSKGGCDIYVSRKQGETWDLPLNLGYPVNTRYWESTPFLTLDGRKLYFSSTRPGGYGGMDIWISEWRTEGGWSEPINAGPAINTSRDELAPYVHGDGRSIYFSSSGWIGMGGLDLFVSTRQRGKGWSIPVNLGYPVNTHGEEMGISFHSKSNFAVFSSNRDSATGRDIFRFYLKDSLAPGQLTIVSGKVINAVTKEPITAVVQVEDHDGKLISRVESDPLSGQYLIGLPVDKDHRFVVNRQGFLFYSAYLPSDSLAPGKSFDWDILLEPFKLGSKVILRNVFFETDSFTIKKESFPELLELVELLSQNAQSNIEIGGHTDNTGDYEYNVNLSRARAESVRQFLVSKGIAPKRLAATGYGPDQPLSNNNTEQGRADNRRTEIRITSTR